VGIVLLYAALDVGMRNLISTSATMMFILRMLVGVIVLSIVILVAKLRKQTLEEIFYINKTSGKNIWLAVLLGVLLTVLTNSENIVRWFSVDFLAFPFQYEFFWAGVRVTALAISLAIVFSIIPIICVEFIYRGAIFYETRKLVSVKLAIIILCVVPVILPTIVGIIWWREMRLFGLYHLLSLFFLLGVQILPLFVSMIVPYMLCYKTNSIWVPITASVIFSVFNNIMIGIQHMVHLYHVPYIPVYETGDIIDTFVFRLGLGEGAFRQMIRQQHHSLILVLCITAVIALILWRMFAKQKSSENLIEGVDNV